MIEAIRITRASYPYRVTQEDFIKRFKGLQSKEWNRQNSMNGLKSYCMALLSSLLIPPAFEIDTKSSSKTKTFEVGKTKVYFSSAILEFLEVLRGKQLYIKIELIQKTYRGSKIRQWFEKFKLAVIKIQSISRMKKRQRRLMKIYSCVISIQCAFRAKKAQSIMQYRQYLRNIITLQSCMRMFISRSKF